jgi:hypothetical protein
MGCTNEICRKFTNSSRKTNKIPFWILRQFRPLVWNMPVNSNRGLEHAADLHKVCFLVAHRLAEAAACVCHPETDGWSQKWQKLPLEGRNRRNLGLLLWPRKMTGVLSVDKPVLSVPKKARQVMLNIKSMLVILFDCEGIAHQEFVPPLQAVNRH